MALKFCGPRSARTIAVRLTPAFMGSNLLHSDTCPADATSLVWGIPRLFYRVPTGPPRRLGSELWGVIRLQSVHRLGPSQHRVYTTLQNPVYHRDRIYIMNFPDLPHLRQLQRDLWQGPTSRAAVMVGSGFSLNAEPLPGARSRFPLWQELARAMFAAWSPRGSESDEDRERRLNRMSALRIASDYEAEFGKRKLELLIREQIPDQEHQPGELHRLLLGLPWADVFTTNYDTLLERTEVNGRAYQPVTEPKELVTAIAPRIVKLHGTLPLGPFIASEEDYRTYPQKWAPFVNCVQQSLLENAFVLIGFSGDDPNFLEWIGWIRDHLGEHHAPIYLVGAFSFENTERALLGRRGVTPIDLAPIVGNDPRVGIEWFLASLLAGREFWYGDWPGLGRQSPHVRPGIPEPAGTGGTIPASIDLSPGGRLTHEDVVGVRDRWRFERENYPGWIVAPQRTRSTLWQATKNCYVALIAASKDWPIEDRIAVLREINWRFEIIMAPFSSDDAAEFRRTVDEISDAVRQGKIRPNQNLISAWFEIAFALQRDARESYDARAWDDLNTKIDAMADKHRIDGDRVQYETALWKMWNLDRPAARHTLSNWQPSPRSPLANLHKASLVAELGDLGEARTILRSALSEVRRSLRIRAGNIELLSIEGWCTYLLARVEPVLDWKKYGDVYEEFKERWQELKLYECDPWDYMEYFDTALSANAPKPPKSVERIPGFDPGIVTISRKFAWDLLTPLLPAFARIRLNEQVGIPVCLPGVVGGDALPNACRWITPYTGFESPALLIRARSDAFLADRSQARSIDPTIARRLYSWCLNVLNGEIALIAGPIPMGSTTQTLLDVLAKVLSKLAFRADMDALSGTLPTVLRLHQHPSVRMNAKLHDSCVPWFRRLFFAADPALLLEWLPTLIRAPLPEQSIQPEIAFGQWSPDAMQFFPGASLIGASLSDEVLSRIQSATGWLLTRAKSESGEGRWTAVLRLIGVHGAGLMSEEQQTKFGELLWERRNAACLPDLERFSSDAFLKLPAPPDIDAISIVKQYVLTMPLGNMVSRTADGRLRFGGVEARLGFIYQALAVSRPVVLLRGERNGTVDWSGEEVKQLYTRALEWWANDRQAFDLKTPDLMGAADSVRATAAQVGAFLSRIVLPNMESAEEDQWRRVLTLLQELREVAAFPTEALPYVLLHRPAELSSVVKTISEDLGSDDERAIGAAAKAIRHWAQLSASDRVPELPSNLVAGMVERVALRRRPGVVSCLVQLTLLLAESPGAIAIPDATLLSASLVPWYEATDQLGDTGCSGDLEDIQQIELRQCVGGLAGALRTWYATQSPGVPEHPGIAKWEQWCASDVLPEVRRAFSAGETAHAN